MLARRSATFSNHVRNSKHRAMLDNEWNLSNSNNIPHQSNGIDCGVFVCQLAERLSRRAPFDFNQEQMPAIRIMMLEQLVAGPFPLPPSNQEVALAPPQTPSNPVIATEQHPTRFDMSPIGSN